MLSLRWAKGSTESCPTPAQRTWGGGGGAGQSLRAPEPRSQPAASHVSQRTKSTSASTRSRCPRPLLLENLFLRLGPQEFKSLGWAGTPLTRQMGHKTLAPLPWSSTALPSKTVSARGKPSARCTARPHPAPLTARRPRLRAGRRGRSGLQQGGGPGWPKSRLPSPWSRKYSPRAGRLPKGLPTSESVGPLTDPGSQAPEVLCPEPPAPPASADPALVTGFPTAQVPPPAAPVPGHPTHLARTETQPRGTVWVRSSSSAPAGPRRKPPLAPPRPQLSLPIGLWQTLGMALPRERLARSAVHPPDHALSGGSVGQRSAGQSGSYCCCVIGARPRPLAAAPWDGGAGAGRCCGR